MEVFREIFPLRSYIKMLGKSGSSIGLVPTMGALHEGHLSLVRHAKKENDITICSIYVNPTQFNNSTDLIEYPRTLEGDLKLLREEGCNIVFVPDDQEMYKHQTTLKFDFGELEKHMEGKHRPGHFNGVAVVVSKLFHIVQPDRAYFGQKDLQQYSIIKQLVKSLSFPVELRRVDTVREKDGLAKSSRNLRLSPEDRKKSVVLYQSLVKAKKLLEEGESAEQALKEAKEVLNVPGVTMEYIDLVDVNTLKPILNISKENTVAVCVAAVVGEVRLIDNMVINLSQNAN